MDRALSPQTSMTLKVSKDDASRMLQASDALNKRLAVLKQEENGAHAAEQNTTDEDDAPVPKRVVSTSDNETDNEQEESLTLIEKAASSCGNLLVQSFLAYLKKSGMPRKEIRVCLLLFLDMTKSNKLIKAFETLNSKQGEDTTLSVKADGAVTLFRCLLTAISLCIHQTSETTDTSRVTRRAAPKSAQRERRVFSKLYSQVRSRRFTR